MTRFHVKQGNGPRSAVKASPGRTNARWCSSCRRLTVHSPGEGNGHGRSCVEPRVIRCRDAVSRETRRGRTISVVFGERCRFYPRASDRFATMRRTNRSGCAPRSWCHAWRCTSYVRQWLPSIRVEPLFHVKPGATGAQVDFARERHTAPPKSPLPWPQLGVATSQSFLE